MEAIPRKYGEWGQFDRYCKLVLYHEAIDYLREMKCRRDREVSLDAVSPADWDKLSTVDRYSCDSFRTRIHNHSTPSERVFCRPAALKNLAIHKVLSAFFRLAGQQNPSPIRHPLIMNTGSYRGIMPNRRTTARVKGKMMKAMLGRVRLWNSVTTIAMMHRKPRIPP